MHRNIHQICVHVIEARNIFGMDTSHMSDVLCTVNVGPTAGVTKSTETKYSTVNCDWNATFHWEDVALADDEFKKEKIRFQVFNRNVWRKNALIGQYEFSVDNVYRQKNHEYYRTWVPLALPDAPAKRMGLLLISVYVLKPNDTKPSHESKDGMMDEKSGKAGSKEGDTHLIETPKVEEKKPYVLNALIYKGAHVLATQAVSVLNPFVSIRFNSNTQQTKFQYNTSNPTFNVKFEMPFHTPLASDSVEVQLWNYRKGLPDVLIGSRTFSFFHLRLTHKAWGPEWVNLYSSNFSSQESTVLGRLQDTLTASAESPTDNEYVGRILLRLSVAERDLLPPKLIATPCPPGPDPAGVEYTLYCLLYSASEIPVLGGHIQVEVCFGEKRSKSQWMLGSSGSFQWNALLRPIDAYCPIDTHQIHDVILNVYHKVGMSVRKIAFERISVADLLMQRDKNAIGSYLHNPAAHEPIFFVNGTSRLRDRAPWRPVWRTMKHVFHDREHPHVVPGFLLCSLGFGLKNCAPPAKDVPQHVSAKRQKYTLRAYVHQAANLLTANDRGSADPFLVIRFGDKHHRLTTQRNTLFPFWYECVDIEVMLPTLPSDLENAPSVYIMVYHEGTADHTLLGRAEVLADHIDRNPNRLYRYRLRYDRQVYADTKSDEPKDTDPYLLCSFELFHPGQVPKQRDGWYPNKCYPPMKWKSPARGGDEKDSPFGALKRYTVKIEAIGLRNMPINITEELSAPMLELAVPSLEKLQVDLKEDVQNKNEFWQRREMRCADVRGNGCQVMRMAEIQCSLHTANLHGVPVWIRLIDKRPNGDRLIGSTWRPLADFIDGHIDRPPWYNYDFKLSKWGVEKTKGGDTKDGATGDSGDTAASGTAAADDLNSITISIGSDEKKGGAGGGGGGGGDGSDRKMKRVVEGLDLDAVGDDLNSRVVDQQIALLAPAKPFSLDDDKEKSAAGEVTNPDGTTSTGAISKDAADLDSNVKGELEKRTENTLKKTPFYVFELKRGKLIGIGYMNQRITGAAPANTEQKTAMLKAFIRVAPIEQQSKLEQQKDLLEPIVRVYEEEFVARVYVYKALHLTPRDRRVGVYQSADPFLVVRNGTGPNHLFNERANSQESNLAPEFFQHFDLPTRIPLNNELEVSIWDKDEILSDEQIGHTIVDVEDRLLLKLAVGEKEWRRLNVASSTTPQGKVLIRVDILTADQAARQKPDVLQPPPKREYEFRLVLWNTKDCRLPDEKSKNAEMDQRLSVTANFTGQYGRDSLKWTDTAWYAAGGAAEWNYRMKYRVTLPCKVPRLKLQLWSAGMISDGEACGEILYNLAPFFNRCLRDNLADPHSAQEPVAFAHPNYPGVNMGELYLEMWLLTAEDADLAPVGEAQSDPNRDPWLPDPSRNPPPWAVGTRGLNALDRYRMIFLCVCAILIILPILIPIILVVVNGSV